MTREDIERMFSYQAADAAYKYAGERCRKDRPISASKLEAFEAGADWAQKFMIERACEWLLDNAHLYVYATTKEKRALLFDNFKKTMEE